MATVGEILKAARETQGHTLEEVAALTRIHLKYLQWLEADDLGTMPEESYFLGFLSAYAYFLGLPASELCYRLLSQYKILRQGKKNSEKAEGADTSATTGKHKPSSVRPASDSDPAQLKIFPQEKAPPASMVARLEQKLDAQTAVKESQSKKDLTPREETPAIGPARPYGVYFILALFLLAAFYFAFPHLKSIFTEKEKAPPAVTSTAPAPAPAPITPAPAPPAAANPTPPVPNLPLRLEARAKEDTWLGMRIDGASNRQEFVLKKGERTTWWAKERFTVTVGNAGGLELILNGKSLGTLGKRGEVIPDMQLTKEGRK